MAFPSTFVDLQDSVLSKGRLDAAADRVKVKDWLNETLSDAVLQTEALVTVMTMVPTSSASQPLPAAVLRIKGMYVSSGGVQYQPMWPVSLEQMLERRQGSPAASVDTPTLYTLSGLNTIDFWATPRGTETITIYAVTAPPVMTADADVPPLPEPFASKVLEYGALAEAADFKRDDQLQNYQARYQEWIAKLRSHLTRKRGGVPEQMLVLGTPAYAPHDRSTDTGWW